MTAEILPQPMENGKKTTVPAAFQHLKRGLALVVCLVFFVWRAVDYPNYWSKTLWALETALYGVLFVNYRVRGPAVSAAWGIRELAAPYFIAALPFAAFLMPVDGRWLSVHPGIVLLAQGLLLVGTALTVAGMATLRSSFSISVEARKPVTHGLYRWIRHPIYLGEFISILGVMTARLSWPACLLTAAFIGLQSWRACWEEQKLSATFPAYAAWRATTGMFFPRFSAGRSVPEAPPDSRG